jgi:site-specific recombinase XerD
MGRISPSKPATSCAGCLAWGVLPGRFCRACYTFAQLHDPGDCAACRRRVPTKKGYCRLCWLQASLDAKDQVTVLQPFLERVTHQQLFFAGMHRIRQPGPLLGKQGRRKPCPQPGVDQPSPSSTAGQQLRFDVDVRRDYTSFDRRRADLSNPILVHARRHARAIGETRGWTQWVAGDVDRALVILLSSHTTDNTADDGSIDKVRFSELFPVLRRYGLSAERTIEVLADLDLFDDDRAPAFECWLDRKLADVAPGIRRDVERWLRTLRDGGPRAKARSQHTVWGYLAGVVSVLVDWSTRYHHLREVTRDDVLAVATALHGGQRRHTLSVLRSLFRHAKKTGAVFADPTARIRIGRHDYGVILPLQPGEVGEAVSVATTPAARLALILAAVHATRPKTIRELLLEDVDLGNRRLIINGRIRPLDDLTRDAVLAWLDYRRTRSPNTANPHLIVSQQSAMETGPVSSVWLTNAFRGQTATLERLRVDRQLDEALVRGPDPLHLASVFGLDEKTAIRYANAASQILQSPAEQYDPDGSPRTQGSAPGLTSDRPSGSH